MARRRHRGQRPARPCDRLAVRQHPIRRIVEIEGGVGARAVILDRERGAADDRRAGRRGERPAGGTVVAMGVGAEDRRDPLARRGGEDRVDMLRQIGPGIDHRDLAVADDIGLRAGIGEGRGIGGEQAPHAGRDPLDLTRGKCLLHAGHVASGRKEVKGRARKGTADLPDPPLHFPRGGE